MISYIHLKNIKTIMCQKEKILRLEMKPILTIRKEIIMAKL